MELPSPGVSQRRALVVVAVAAAALLLGSRLLGHGGGSAQTIPPLRTATRARAPSRAELVVDVAGAVRVPGLHRLAQGSRIADALTAAGGATAKADLALVNLAAPLADGEQVLVPERGTAGAGVSGAPSAAAPLDLNTATAEQLDALPGIGPATAAKIVAFRQAHGPFRSVDELDAVPGIGPSRIDQLKGLVLP